MARPINSGGGIYYGSLKLEGLININATRDSLVRRLYFKKIIGV